MSTSDTQTSVNNKGAGLPSESSDQLFTDKQLFILLPVTWASMWGFIAIMQYYPRLILLNWPLLILFGYLYFIRSSP